MRKILLISTLIICMLLIPITSYADVKITYKQEEQQKLDVPTVGCKAVYIAEPVTGKVIYEKNAHEVRYPASTTKILTALVVLENCNVDDTAIVSHNAIALVPDGYSNANLREGEVYKI